MTATPQPKNSDCLCSKLRAIVVPYVADRLKEYGLSVTMTIKADVYAACSAMCATVDSLVADAIRNSTLPHTSTSPENEH